jgi:hypothetical protein
VLIVVAVLAIGGFCLGRGWQREPRARLLVPVMLGIGLAVAMAVPLLLMNLAAKVWYED